VPDTYRITPGVKVTTIIKMLLSTFRDRVYGEYNFSSNDKLYEILIFASILEKEEKDATNKPIVAGILKKRYEEKWPIGADATVCYAYGLTMKDCTPDFI
jgi:cell division protein YceG involved in septum cleavage